MKYLIIIFSLIGFWSIAVSDTTNTFEPVEIRLKTGESYSILGITIKLLTANAKWTVSGSSGLVVSIEINNENKKEVLHFSHTGEIHTIDWETINISLLNGDNGMAKLAISPK